MTSKKAKPSRQKPSAKGQNEAVFQWTEEKSRAAVMIAEGQTQREIASELGVNDRTIRKWLAASEFAEEVDKLSVMIGVASRAYRLRLAQRVIRQLTADAVVTDKDILDWLKYAQSETSGIKLSLDSAFNAAVASLAGGGQTSPGQPDSGDSSGTRGS